MSETMTVGRAAAASGLRPKAIRLYETRGLIEPAARTESGYRTYGPEDVALLTFIRRAKSLGLHLDEIRQIIDLQRGGRQPCTTVLELVDGPITEIDNTIADLHALRSALAAVRRDAKAAIREGRNAVVCTIIENTTPPAPGPNRRARNWNGRASAGCQPLMRGRGSARGSE
jgi:MerR family copper efflux transcriptional regulator